jgi:hypothetical protein
MLVVVLCIVFWAVVENNRRKAERFFRYASTLEIGGARYSDVQRTLRDYSQYLNYPDPCSAQDCTVTFQFHNSWLKTLHLAPGTVFGGDMVFRDGVLGTREFYLGQGRCCVAIVDEGRHLLPAALADPSSPNFSKKLWRGDSAEPLKVWMLLTPEASSEQRRLAYDFNLGCLSKLGGCKSGADLSPSVWKK